LGVGKRLFPERGNLKFKLLDAKPFPSGVVGLHYLRERG
jgi:hypothetical protein